MVPITMQFPWLQVIDGDSGIGPPTTRFWSECEKLGYPRLAFDTRLWKWLASSSPHLWNCLCNYVLRVVQLCLTAYGNGWQAVLPIYGTVCVIMSYELCNRVLRLMEMAGKQFSHLWKRF